MDGENLTYLRHDFPAGICRWAISRWVEGRWIHLVENSCLDYPGDKDAVLRALYIDPAEEDIKRYFRDSESRGPCPTIDLLERFARLDPTIMPKKTESGV